MRHSPVNLALAVVTSLLIAHPGMADDWPRFRGPNGSGVASGDKPTPTEWSPTKNVKWKAALPGSGVSSPIVVGDRVFVTCYSGYGIDRRNPGDIKDLKRHLVCVDKKTGKTLWDKTVPAAQPEDPYSGAGVPSHGYASHTPVSDGERVYVFFGKSGALAFDMDGKQLWQADLGKESDPRRWGSASSPILHKDILIVTAGPESRALVGLDAKTGKELWKAEAEGLGNVWGTPVLAKAGEARTDLVIGAPTEVWGLDPKTGKLRWYNESLSARNTSVVAQDGVIYALESAGRGRGGEGSSGGGGGAIKAGGDEDTTKERTVWTARAGSSFSTPVIHDGRAYLVSSGLVTCLDAKTGKEVYKERLSGSSEAPRGRGGFGSGIDYSSPVIAGGKLYYVKSSGVTHVIKLGDEFEELSVNKVTEDSETFSASPAVSDGEIFLRSTGHLYCVSGS